MMVIFVSECQKNALKKTRRILDAFANRIGDNTWQTIITEEGLQNVKLLLRKSASKNTAVSCHWIRSRSRSQFLWVVGNKRKFNNEGVVPVNRTQRQILKKEIEHDWQYLPLIKALVGLASLLHDWGKANSLFQEKLQPKSQNKYKGDPLRHEWISCLLLNALIDYHQQQDQNWLVELANGRFDEAAVGRHLMAMRSQQQIKKPLENHQPVAQYLLWLIISHHRLPQLQQDQDIRHLQQHHMDAILKQITCDWGYENRREEYQQRLGQCFDFSTGSLSQSKSWLTRLKRWAAKLQLLLPLIEQIKINGSDRLVLHHARLALMLGDHYFSSQSEDQGWHNTTHLYANTDRNTSELKQQLDEHLVGVESHATRIAHLLPSFEQELPQAEDVQSLRKSSPEPFEWQDKAVKKIKQYREQVNLTKQGFFVVNMASTGCGKTYANAKVMRALSDDGKSLRYILALGLRTLTLQTGDEYERRIFAENSRENLAVVIGSKAVADLHQQNQKQLQQQSPESNGSESSESLFDDEIDYNGMLPQEGFSTILPDNKSRKLLCAPVLVCTIDHIIAATETKRGGRYILPSLRLLSSDLVIDEVDDFTGSDLIAISRLIHLAGMLGRKVMISSATIAPSLAEGLFNAYRLGWQLFSQTRGTSTNIGCVWIDEFDTQVASIANLELANKDYQNQHQHFVDQRIVKLKKQPAKRRADLVYCQAERLQEPKTEHKQAYYFSLIQQAIQEKHAAHHTIDPKTGIAVSFGVVRVANISPCVELTRYLLECPLPEETELRVMAYHSNQVLLLRHEQEKHLDQVLKRNEQPDQQPKAFTNREIRHHLDRSHAKQMIFVLVATPVEEVGRDHDFDWAVVEPSSYRSIIQLAGRVRRHRQGSVTQPNIALMQYNWKAFNDGDKAGQRYFNYPGFEVNRGFKSHDLSQLMDLKQANYNLNAIPRLQLAKDPQNHLLATLEHVIMKSDLNNYQECRMDTLQGYLQGNWYLTAMSQKIHRFREKRAGTLDIRLFLVFDSMTERCYLAEKDQDGRPIEVQLPITQTTLSARQEKRLWLKRDYRQLLHDYAACFDLSPYRVSTRFGELNFESYPLMEYQYNDQLGLVKIKRGK